MPSPGRQIYSDEEFARWCESNKQCKRCAKMFVGPVCECERPKLRKLLRP